MNRQSNVVESIRMKLEREKEAFRESVEEPPSQSAEVANPGGGIQLNLQPATDVRKILSSNDSETPIVQALLELNPSLGMSATELADRGLAFDAPVVPKISFKTGQTPAKKSALHPNSWPDPNFDGYKKIGLEPRFVIVPVEGLRKALNGRLPIAEPNVVPGGAVREFNHILVEAGASEHTTARPLSFGKFSGGAYHWVVRGAASPSPGYVIDENGVNRGAMISPQAHHPDWVPLALNVRPLLRPGGHLRCSVGMNVGNGITEETTVALETEWDIPVGSMLVWASTNEARSGFAQLALLHNLSEGRDDDADPLALPERRGLLKKLHQITLNEVEFKELPLKEVIRILTDESRRRDPENTGVNFLITSSVDAPSAATEYTVDPATGAPVPIGKDARTYVDIGNAMIEIATPIKDIRLIDVLDAIVLVADQPIKYTVEDYAVVFSPKTPEQGRLFTRTIKVNPNTMYQELEKMLGEFGESDRPDLVRPSVNESGQRVVTTTGDISAVRKVLIDYFARAGVNFVPPKMLYFNDRTGLLMVRTSRCGTGRPWRWVA